jgi:levansucrase
MTTTAWTRDDVATLVEAEAGYLPVIGDEGAPRLLPDVDFWDLWPMRAPDGTLAAPCDAQVWAGLSAPAVGDPGERHDAARIRLIQRDGDGWRDIGLLFPEGSSAGSREWAGCLLFEPDTGQATAYYTAAGARGEATLTFRQRIMSASAELRCVDGLAQLRGWSDHHEVIAADGDRYQPANEEDGEPGFIKAFRDPFVFRDPADGERYLLFTGSLAQAQTRFNGCIGVARLSEDGWQLLDPLISADGVNNELERPHVVVHDGSYYLFFSTQRRTFDPAVTGPNGLYGFVGPELLGPYRPINGSGLVLQNPPSEPLQAYSWLVLNDLYTTGFVDSFALHGRTVEDLHGAGVDEARANFGGTITPAVSLGLDGDRAWIAGTAAPQPVPRQDAAVSRAAR